MAEQKEEKIKKGSVLEKKEEENIEPPDYSDEEKIYISNFQKRLESAKLARDQSLVEFDGLNLNQYYKTNEDIANTVIKPVKNRGDVIYQSGTLRTKLFAFLSAFQGLNLKADISAYDKNEIPIRVLGDAMEDIIDKTEELELDEEQKMLRQYEMLKQGTVFMEELWEEKWNVEKEISKGFLGAIKGVHWNTKRKLGLGRPRRSFLPLTSVFLGDLRIYDNSNQPYQFTVKIMNRSEAEQIYGKWERWKYVSKDKVSFSGATSEQMISNSWRLTGDVGKDQVEVIKYQDKPNNEFQVILNGVLMLPIGYPLSEITPDGDYTIVQQNLEPIRADFAYGKSFVFKNKNLVAILDEMMKLAVLKTQKSYSPPYLNLSNRTVSKSVFRAGNIARGIQPNELVPVSDKEAQGVTPGEAGVVQEIIRTIDSNTASQTFTGAKEAGGKPTATQIIELQRQARMMMGVLVLAATLLEKKLTIKRIMILLKKWFDPIDTVLDSARSAIKQRYRIVSRERTIEKEGPGIRLTVASDELPDSERLMKAEEELGKKIGKPVRILMLSPAEIRSAKLTWMVNITPKEKKTSELSKLMFSAMISDAINLGLNLDQNWLEEEFASVWERDPNKMFSKEKGGEGDLSATGETSVSPSSPVVKRTKTAEKQPVSGAEQIM